MRGFLLFLNPDDGPVSMPRNLFQCMTPYRDRAGRQSGTDRFAETHAELQR